MKVEADVEPDAAEEIIFAYERRYDKGFREGFREGLGIALRRQLVQRFGELDPKVVQLVLSASTAELDAMLERMVEAVTVDEVIGSSPGARS